MPTPITRNICAVIVTYHPSSDFLDCLPTLIEQVDRIIIVDNGSGPEAEYIWAKLRNDAKIHLIKNNENRGLATALNQGARQAGEDGHPWILLLDQDSFAEDFLLKTFVEIYNQIPEKEKIAVIGSNHIDLNSQERYYPRKYPPNTSWIKRKTVITSGSFISLSTYKDIGPFRDDLFIDGIDHEYCLRARKGGYANILLLKPLLKHRMGNRKTISWPLLPWVRITTTNYPPLRWYFITRNRLVICGQYLLSDFIWSITRILRLLGSIGITLIFEPKRLVKLQYIGLGFWDALLLNMQRKIDS